ncbi:MAG TPA: DUF4105 domain-containing protein [bacterium]|nr:DUF4105 domain-containing protein [bacterium]
MTKAARLPSIGRPGRAPRAARFAAALGALLALALGLLLAVPAGARAAQPAAQSDATPATKPADPFSVPAATLHPIASLSAEQRAYWEDLVAQAGAKRLWEQRFWRLLLHYMPDALGSGYTSEADGPGFFLAPNGRTDPKAELEATLAGFFSQGTTEPGNMTPQCTFPARYRWLNEQLGFDARRLPPQPCERFDRWRRRIDPGSVSLIFSSYYFNNPASMFGHSLLRFNRATRTGDTALLDSAVNYAAFVPPDEGNIAYMVRGVFGGYRGYFSLMPYYLKVREYNDFENRDLWEYRLNFTPSQLDYMVRHVWELGSTYFDYFFFKENCSYHLLSVLEVGRPDLHLRDRYHLWTMPTETVQEVVLEHPDLVAKVIYRPSLSSQFFQQRALLTGPERDLLGDLIDDAAATETDAFRALPPPRAALVLDTAIDYDQYDLAGDPQDKPLKAHLRKLLLRRSRISVPALEADTLPPQSLPPDKGHDSARLEVAGGASRPAPAPGAEPENLPFGQFTIQASFHDLLSDDRAFAPNSQIDLLQLRARYETEPSPTPGTTGPRKLRLERFALMDIVSLFPLTQLNHQPSWKLAIGWQRNRDIGCDHCTPFFLNPGIGISLESHLHQREVYFLMLEGRAEFSHAFTPRHRAGFGLSAGVLVHLADWWRIGLIGTRTHYTAGDAGYVGQGRLESRFSLSRNLELTLDWSGVGNYREGKLGLGWYF